MKSYQTIPSLTPTLDWESELERTLPPLELIISQKIPSDTERVQDESLARTVSILRDKISGG